MGPRDDNNWVGDVIAPAPYRRARRLPERPSCRQRRRRGIPVAESLAREGYLVTRVDDGWAALDRLRQSSVDVAILDQALIGLDGVDVCRLMKRDQDTRLVPVLLLFSGNASQEKRLESIEAGVDELISAPVHVHELTARIRSLVRQKRLHDTSSGPPRT